MGYYLPPLPLLGCCVVSFDLYWQDNFLNNKIQSDKDNFLDNLIYEIAIMGVLGSIFRQDNFLTIYERFWHLGGHVLCSRSVKLCWDRRNSQRGPVVLLGRDTAMCGATNAFWLRVNVFWITY